MDVSAMRRWWRAVAGSGRISRKDAERLLDRRPTRDAHRGVADMLASAAAPARPAELAGEREAVAAFRREHPPSEREHPAAQSSAKTGIAPPGQRRGRPAKTGAAPPGQRRGHRPARTGIAPPGQRRGRRPAKTGIAPAERRRGRR
jgi:hypothetical protein